MCLVIQPFYAAIPLRLLLDNLRVFLAPSSRRPPNPRAKSRLIFNINAGRSEFHSSPVLVGLPTIFARLLFNYFIHYPPPPHPPPPELVPLAPVDSPPPPFFDPRFLPPERPVTPAQRAVYDLTLRCKSGAQLFSPSFFFFFFYLRTLSTA